jgi:hypothetical protein
VPNDAQLASAAGGIAYRAQQLALIGLMIGARIDVRLDPPRPFNAAKVAVNALVECGLVNARALAHFLGLNDTDEVAAVHYGATVPAALADLARTTVLGPVSQHLAHALYPKAKTVTDTKHPGEWPITELAVVLVEGVVAVVESLPTQKADWFVPDPRPLVDEHLGRLRLRRTVRSDNASVARLTTALQAYLDR